MLDRVSIGPEEVNIGPLKVHVLQRLPLDLDVIIGWDVISQRGLQVVPQSGSEADPIVKLG